jgi:uncharacterized protein involved in exopolysaccharide biosynthesis
LDRTSKIQTNNPESEEISLIDLIRKGKELLHFLFSKWRLLMLSCALGGCLGFLLSKFKKPLYTAECTFVLEEQSAGGGLGQYAGIASMIGIDIGGNSSNGIFQGDNIMELYKSRAMVQKTLLSKISIGGSQQLLINRYIEFNGLLKKWAKEADMSNLDFDLPTNEFSLRHDSVMTTIVEDLTKHALSVSRPDKKLSIVSVKVKSRDQLFAKGFTEQIVKNVNDFYVQTKTKKSLENIKILQKQADSLRLSLNSSIQGAASAIDANPNANSALQVLRVPSQRRQIDIQAGSAMYIEVVKNLEISKISLRKETPLIQVIDAPILPLERQALSRSKGIVLGSAVFFLIGVVFLLGRKVLKAI